MLKLSKPQSKFNSNSKLYLLCVNEQSFSHFLTQLKSAVSLLSELRRSGQLIYIIYDARNVAVKELPELQEKICAEIHAAVSNQSASLIPAVIEASDIFFNNQPKINVCITSVVNYYNTCNDEYPMTSDDLSRRLCVITHNNPWYGFFHENGFSTYFIHWDAANALTPTLNSILLIALQQAASDFCNPAAITAINNVIPTIKNETAVTHEANHLYYLKKTAPIEEARLKLSRESGFIKEQINFLEKFESYNEDSVNYQQAMQKLANKFIDTYKETLNYIDADIDGDFTEERKQQLILAFSALVAQEMQKYQEKYPLPSPTLKAECLAQLKTQRRTLKSDFNNLCDQSVELQMQRETKKKDIDDAAKTAHTKLKEKTHQCLQLPQLIQAVNNNSILEVQKALSHLDIKKTINEIDGQGYTALHHAAIVGNPDIVALLLQHGSNAHLHENSAKEESYTPVHLAAEHGHVEVLKLLLTSNNINTPDFRGYTPLHTAAYNNQEGALSFLLTQKANRLCVAKDGSTPLHDACKKGSFACVQVLIQFKANPNQKDLNGNSPLKISIVSGYHEVVAYLLQLTDELDPLPLLLQEAIKNKIPKVVEVLANFMIKKDLPFDFKLLLDFAKQKSMLNLLQQLLFYIDVNEDVSELKNYRADLLEAIIAAEKNYQLTQGTLHLTNNPSSVLHNKTNYPTNEPLAHYPKNSRLSCLNATDNFVNSKEKQFYVPFKDNKHKTTEANDFHMAQIVGNSYAKVEINNLGCNEQVLDRSACCYCFDAQGVCNGLVAAIADGLGHSEFENENKEIASVAKLATEGFIEGYVASKDLIQDKSHCSDFIKQLAETSKQDVPKYNRNVRDTSLAVVGIQQQQDGFTATCVNIGDAMQFIFRIQEEELIVIPAVYFDNFYVPNSNNPKKFAPESIGCLGNHSIQYKQMIELKPGDVILTMTDGYWEEFAVNLSETKDIGVNPQKPQFHCLKREVSIEPQALKTICINVKNSCQHPSAFTYAQAIHAHFVSCLSENKKRLLQLRKALMALGNSINDTRLVQDLTQDEIVLKNPTFMKNLQWYIKVSQYKDGKAIAPDLTRVCDLVELFINPSYGDDFALNVLVVPDPKVELLRRLVELEGRATEKLQQQIATKISTQEELIQTGDILYAQQLPGQKKYALPQIQAAIITYNKNLNKSEQEIQTTHESCLIS